jgi:transposase
MPFVDPVTALPTDLASAQALIATLTAQMVERDRELAVLQAEQEAAEHRIAEAEARERIAFAAAKMVEADAARRLAGAAERLANMDNELAAALHEVKRLTDILDAFKRHRFGQSAERLDPDQYQLVLEELEAALSHAEAGLEALIDKLDGKTREQQRRRTNRGALPAHLERVEQLIDIDDKHCTCCGHDLHVIDEDVTERLDVVPTIFRVLRTRRPRYGCRGCDEAGVIQAPAPSFIVDQGLPTDALVAQVLVSRFADHTPLYRQAQIYARYGLDLDRSTFSDWIGRAAWWLEPLHRYLLGHLRSSEKLFADETRMPVLAPRTGKTRTGQLWAYARDDRAWGGTAAPAVVYMYATGRGSEHPVDHLGTFTGVLQVDGYAGYNEIARRNGIKLALCLSHARRKFYDHREKEPVAAEVLRRFTLIYKLEAGWRGKSPEARVDGRQLYLKPLFEDLHAYLVGKLPRFSAKSKMAEAIRYALNNWDGLTYCLADGRVELDTNCVERSIRPIALSRKNSLFAGSDLGAHHWAVIASMLETCKLSDVDPLAWLTDTFSKLANGHPATDLESLMPWNFRKIERRPVALAA